MKSKQIQIDEALFRELCDFFFSPEAPQGWQADTIRRGISDKLDKLIARELFTEYKRSPSGAEREQARREYLDHIGVTNSFRSPEEVPKGKL